MDFKDFGIENSSSKFQIPNTSSTQHKNIQLGYDKPFLDIRSTGDPCEVYVTATMIVIMTRMSAHSQYVSDLQSRTHQFAQKVREFIKKLPTTVANIEDGKQLVRSSGSIGANYIEANESLGKRDFLYHMRISRKESKESIHWLQLIDCGRSKDNEELRELLIDEAQQFLRIFSSIINNKIAKE